MSFPVAVPLVNSTTINEHNNENCPILLCKSCAFEKYYKIQQILDGINKDLKTIQLRKKECLRMLEMTKDMIEMCNNRNISEEDCEEDEECEECKSDDDTDDDT
jgi:hypothetical protein